MALLMLRGRRRLVSAAAGWVSGHALLLSGASSRAIAAGPPSATKGPVPLAQRFVPVAARDSVPPPLALADLEGKAHDLKALRGRVVLVNFWATWCAPCLEELPSLQLLQAKMEREPFTLLTVNHGESVERVRKFVDSMRLDLPVLLDAFHRVRHDWNVRSLPASFVIDPRGRLRYTVRGELDWASEAVVAKLRTTKS